LVQNSDFGSKSDEQKGLRPYKRDLKDFRHFSQAKEVCNPVRKNEKKQIAN
jgi:hypothetical protein